MTLLFVRGILSSELPKGYPLHSYATGYSSLGFGQSNSSHQPAGRRRSLREVANGRAAAATSRSVEEDFSAWRLGYRQLLGEVIETRDVIYAVLIHHASQLGIYLQGKRKE